MSKPRRPTRRGRLRPALPDHSSDISVTSAGRAFGSAAELAAWFKAERPGPSTSQPRRNPWRLQELVGIGEDRVQKRREESAKEEWADGATLDELSRLAKRRHERGRA